MKSGSDFAKGIALGAVVGAVGVILASPKVRGELSDTMKEKYEMVKKKISEKKEEYSDDAQAFFDDLVAKGKMTEAEGKDMLNRIKKTMKES